MENQFELIFYNFFFTFKLKNSFLDKSLFTIAHSYREVNTCADHLANLWCDSEVPLIVYEFCPVSLG